MRRVDIPELHERPWFPQGLRDLVTDALQFILNVCRFYQPIAGKLEQAISESGARRVVDLCSGGGGPWLWLYRQVGSRGKCPLEIILTDKYPNAGAFEYARGASGGAIRYAAKPVEAAHIPAELTGFRTIFSSFHHFSPPQIVGMLQDAADQRQGFGAFEGAARRTWTIMGIFVVPLAVLATTPFIRPFRASRLLWTYLPPVIPLVLFIDGLLSCLRAYLPSEMNGMCAQVSAPGYLWEAGEAQGRFGRVTYLIGYPSAKMRGKKAAEAILFSDSP
jgi:hypothetical protein